MQKVKEIFAGKHEENTSGSSPRNSLSNQGGYDTTDNYGSDNLSGNGSGLTGDRNIHSGSTGVGSNIGRGESDISGGRGLGNAATGSGDRYESGRTGTSGTGAGITALTGDRDSRRSGYNDDGLGSRSTGTRTSVGSTGQSTGHHHDKISGQHTVGHDSRDTTRFDPTGPNTDHDHKHLQAVTHETVRHSEVEEVERQRELHRHVHHLQHHVQPVKDQVVQPEVIHQQSVAPTHITEKHVNTEDDVKLFASLGQKHRDTEQHLPKERTVVDLGEQVNTVTHHHVHHVTQPVVEKEVLERHRIHTTIPLVHTVHEAPIIHKSSVHEPVQLQDFLKGGGKLDSGITHETAGILSTGDCDREVDGVGERMVQELNLKPSTFNSSSTTSGSGIGSRDNIGTRDNSLGSRTGESTLGSRTGHGESLTGNRTSESTLANRTQDNTLGDRQNLGERRHPGDN